MELLTEEIKQLIPPLGSQSGNANPVFPVKFFTPDGGWTWYVAEGEPYGEHDFLLYGYVIGIEPEWGNFALSELQSVRGALGLPVERDLHFTPTSWSVIKERGW